MRATHRNYQSFDEFEREELRAGEGPGWNFDQFVEQVTVEDDEYRFVSGEDLLVGDEEEDEDEDEEEESSDAD
jgi:hypothetical protein